MKGSSYTKLTPELDYHMKGLINLQNKDDECFRWCHVRLLYPDETKNPERITKKDKEIAKQLNYDGFDFPFTIKQVNKVKKQYDIRINVFGYESKQTFPIYV